MLRTRSSLRPESTRWLGCARSARRGLRHPAAFYRKKTRNVAGEPVVARLIAVATHAQTHDGAKKLADLQPRLVSEIKEFFVTYNKPRTQIQVQGRGELEKAPS
jgi:hypothetical protein